MGVAKTLAHGGYEGEPVLTLTDSTVFRQGPKIKGLEKIFLRHGKFGYIYIYIYGSASKMRVFLKGGATDFKNYLVPTFSGKQKGEGYQLDNDSFHHPKWFGGSLGDPRCLPFL